MSDDEDDCTLEGVHVPLRTDPTERLISRMIAEFIGTFFICVAITMGERATCPLPDAPTATHATASKQPLNGHAAPPQVHCCRRPHRRSAPPPW